MPSSKKGTKREGLTVIQMKIDSCMACPFHHSEREYTGDSFEMVFQISCRHEKADKRKASKLDDPHPFVGYDEDRHRPPVPTWCPLRLKRRKKK